MPHDRGTRLQLSLARGTAHPQNERIKENGILLVLLHALTPLTPAATGQSFVPTSLYPTQ